MGPAGRGNPPDAAFRRQGLTDGPPSSLTRPPRLAATSLMLEFLSRGLRGRPAIDEAVRAAAPRTVIALGMTSGLAVTVIPWALALAAATIIGFGSGTPSSNFRAVLAATWSLVLVLIVAGGVAAISRRYVLGLHSGWGRIGAGVALFGVFLLLSLTWAFRQRLIQGDALTRQSVYEVPGGLYQATEADGLLLIWFGLAALIGAVLFTVTAGGVLDYLIERRLPVAESESEYPAPPVSDFQRNQTGLGRLKLEIRELRRRTTERPEGDPIISATDVIDRETGRTVPPWMEPVADLNFGLGKGLLIAFIFSALVWFAAVALKAPEEWLVWRNAIFVTPRAGALIVPIDLAPNISAIRLYAISGEGDIIGGLARRGAPRVMSGRVVRVRGYLDSPQVVAPPNVISFDGLDPGHYALRIDRFSGSLFVGMTAERTSALSTHLLAVVLGAAAAGMVSTGAGLTLLAVANVRAYLDL